MSEPEESFAARQSDNKSIIFAVGACFFAGNIVVQMHGNVVPLSFQQVFGLSEMMIGTLTGVVNLVVSLILLLTNRFRPRFGVVTALLALAGGSVLLMQGAEAAHALWLFILSFFAGAVFTSITKVSATKYIVVGDGQQNKSKSMAIVKTMEVLGGFTCLVLINRLSGAAMFYTMGAVVLILSGFMLTQTRRVNRVNPEQRAEREKMSAFRILRTWPGKAFVLLAVCFWYMGYDAMSTTFSRYAVNAWHMEGNSYTVCLIVVAVSATVFYIPAARIFKKKPVLGIVIGLLLIAAGLFLTSLAQSYHVALNLLFIMIGVGWSCVAVNGVIITAADVGEDHAGQLVSLYYVANTLSKILAPVISGAILEYLPYRSLYAILSLFFLLAIGFLYLGQRLHRGSVEKP